MAEFAPVSDDARIPVVAAAILDDVLDRAADEGRIELVGELGSALFSAASGLRGLNDLRAALDKEADGRPISAALKGREPMRPNTAIWPPVSSS